MVLDHMLTVSIHARIVASQVVTDLVKAGTQRNHYYHVLGDGISLVFSNILQFELLFAFMCSKCHLFLVLLYLAHTWQMILIEDTFELCKEA